MKKTKMTIALALSSCLGFAQLVTNGGFESYNTLPTSCPTSISTLPDVNNWTEFVKELNYNGTNCLGGYYAGYPAVYPQATYFNNATGGNGSCAPLSPHSGNAYIVSKSKGRDYTGAQCNYAHDFVYQSISGLLSTNKYLFTAYVYDDGSYYLASKAIPGLTSSISGLYSAPTPTITGTSPGWKKVQSILTVPSNGTYYLIIGDNTYVCNSSYGNYYGIALDDVSLEIMPCAANAGPNAQDQNTSCCGCSTTGVQIGTAAVSGYSYSWAPNTNLSSTTVAQPTSTWCHVGTPITYTVSVSGSDCATATSTVQVSTHAYVGSNCCRLMGINAPANADGQYVVYPNPARETVSVSLAAKAEYVRLIDIQGKIVFEAKNVEEPYYEINLSKISKGVYFVVSKMGDTIEKEKLLVE